MISRSRSWLVCSILSVALFGSIGCGSSGTPAPSQSETPTISNKEEMKKRLTDIAASGIGGSAVSGLREGFEKLKTSDAALADSLLKDLAQLETLQDSEQIKKLAGSMADKL
jgi:hypothetical protein